MATATDRPYVSFQQVKERVSMADVLDALGVADQFRREGKQLVGVCPLPEHQHGPRPNPQQFKISVDKNLWHCFGDCSRGGDVIEFVKLMQGLSDSHVRFWFAEHFGERLDLQKLKRQAGEGETKKACGSDADTSSEPQAKSLATPNLPDEAGPLKPLTFTLRVEDYEKPVA